MANQIVFTDRGSQPSVPTQESRLKWFVILLGIPLAGICVVVGIALALMTLLLVAMGAILAVPIVIAIAVPFVLVTLGIVKLYSKQRYWLAIVLILVAYVILLAPIGPDSKSILWLAIKSEPLQAVMRNNLPTSMTASGQLVIPEGIFLEKTYKKIKRNYETSNSTSYLKRGTFEQVNYSYEKGKSCSIEVSKYKDRYERVDCSPNGALGTCYRYSEAHLNSPQNDPKRVADNPVYKIEDAGSCVTIRFNDTNYSTQEQMLRVVNSLKRVE